LNNKPTLTKRLMSHILPSTPNLASLSYVKQLTVAEANNFAIPLIDSTIGRAIGHTISPFDGDQDDLVDMWGYIDPTNRLLGVIGLGTKLPGINRYYLGYFTVDTHYRCQGIGKNLLTYLESNVIAPRRIERIVVETYDTDYFHDARQFYQHNGFAWAGSLEGFLPNGGSAIFYSKEYNL
jgi:ribosomal protein S18 acetylase RimI-like enzyme